MIWSVSASGNFKGSLVVSMSKARTTGSWVRANTLRHFKADLKVKVILIRLARPSGGAASKPEPPPGNHFTALSTQIPLPKPMDKTCPTTAAGVTPDAYWKLLLRASF